MKSFYLAKKYIGGEQQILAVQVHTSMHTQ